jgi:FkbM family methyltransferase
MSDLEPVMKTVVKQAVGRGIIPFAQRLSRGRQLLRRLGLRTSQDLFGDRIVSIHFTDGRSFRLAHVDASYLSFQLFWRGGEYYEPITRMLLEELLRPGDTFLDIGAHVGFFTVTIGLSSKTTKIIAFEPNPKNFQILEANTAANGLTNVVCEPIAISDQEGTGTLYLTESDMSASLMKDFSVEDTKQIGSKEVPTASLDGYLQRRQIGGPLVIKVDVEGHEPALFRGAAQTIAARKPDIILEVLYEAESALISQLKSLGYHFYPITDQGLIEEEVPKLVERLPLVFFNHLLSVRPKEELTTIFDRVREQVRKINLLETSKYFPEWTPLTRPDE